MKLFHLLNLKTLYRLRVAGEGGGPRDLLDLPLKWVHLMYGGLKVQCNLPHMKVGAPKVRWPFAPPPVGEDGWMGKVGEHPMIEKPET